jgi:hypothetical protein
MVSHPCRLSTLSISLYGLHGYLIILHSGTELKLFIYRANIYSACICVAAGRVSDYAPQWGCV